MIRDENISNNMTLVQKKICIIGNIMWSAAVIDDGLGYLGLVLRLNVEEIMMITDQEIGR